MPFASGSPPLSRRSLRAPTNQSAQPYRFAYRAQNVPATIPSSAAERRLSFFLATIARSCVLCVTPFVLPAYSYARRWARRAAFGGSRVRPAAAVDSGKLRRASPASGVALSPTTSVVVVVARGDGEAAFVRPRVSVPPAEIGWNERARVREGSLCGGRKVCTPRVSAGFLLQLLRR